MKNFNDVKWTNKATLADGTEVATSSVSGIIGVCIPEGNPFYMYSDQLEQLRAALPLVQGYAQTHSEAAPSKGVAKEMSKAIKTQIKAQAKAAETLEKLDDATLEKTLVRLGFKKQA